MMRSAAAEIAQLAVDAPADSLLWMTEPSLVVVAEAGRLLPIAGRLVTRSVPWLLETDDPQHPAVVGHRRALDGWVAPYQTLFRAHWYDVAVAPVVEEGTVVGVKGAAVLKGDPRWMDEVWRPRLTVLGGGARGAADPIAFEVCRDAPQFGLLAGMVLVFTDDGDLVVPGQRARLSGDLFGHLVTSQILALADRRRRPRLRLV